MRVLLLSPYPERLLPAFTKDEPIAFDGPPGDWPAADFVVSYGYRHIIGEPQLSHYRDRMINLHIGLLPWNRGAHPNFWSWFDDTPKGVSIHRIDEDVDTGPLIFRQYATLHSGMTLRQSYAHLHEEAANLFVTTWPAVTTAAPWPQPPGGSVHYTSEIEPFWKYLPNGWGTPCSDVVALGQRWRRERAAS